MIDRQLLEQLRAARREVRDIEEAIARYPNLDPARSPLPGLLDAARAQLAEVQAAVDTARRPPQDWNHTAIAIVDALLDVPGVTVPPRVAAVLAETIATALHTAATRPESDIAA
jgi:hypothetical protein